VNEGESSARATSSFQETTGLLPTIRAQCPAALAVLAVLGCAGTAVAQSTRLVSVDSFGNQGDHDSGSAAISPNGRWIAFHSEATNLVAGDTNGTPDVFVHDQLTGLTERVSVDSSGGQADDRSKSPAISTDGRYVAFGSEATNLVSGDTNGWEDVFVHDRLTGATERVSVDSFGNEANWFSYCLDISGDGRFVVFESLATNLVPGGTNGLPQIYLRDRLANQTYIVSVDSNGLMGNGTSYEAALTPDGRFVAFTSLADNLVPNDTNGMSDVFLRDLVTGQTTRVSVDSSGNEGHGVDLYGLWTLPPALSADGRYIAFGSEQTDLVPGDTNDWADVFVHDTLTGATERVNLSSSGVQGNDWSIQPSMSADGRHVTFESYATNLVSGDVNGHLDVFLHDRATGWTTLVSVSSSWTQANNDSEGGRITPDARFVAFRSWASNLVDNDTNVAGDIFLRDLAPGSVASFCHGDGNEGACPCGNSGGLYHGCQNSAATGGALLTATGNASLGNDTLQILSAGERSQALSLLLQGDATIPAAHFGDGLRCVGGTLTRLYARNAHLGAVTMPQQGDPSISARSAALGDPISMGATRYYQVYYRDPAATFCPDPPGNTWNVGNALSVVWDP
jgi:Tol biopolymer transport system component